MVATVPPSTKGIRILLFGPQALAFQEEFFSRFSSLLVDSESQRWILDAIDGLQKDWVIVDKAFPQLRHVPGLKLLKSLNGWLRAGHAPSSSFPLPNVLLTPLVIAIQLAQYSKYQENMESRPAGQYKVHTSADQEHSTEVLGFCTGLLSALAVSCSVDQSQLRHTGAIAIRLAMLIGALVDAQDTSTSQYGESISFSAAWGGPNGEVNMMRILERFPEV